MSRRPSPVAALATALAGLVACLAFGSETYLREVVFRRRLQSEGGVFVEVLSAPNYARFGFAEGAGTVGRFAFLLVFPLVLGALVLAIARGSNAFLAGWAAAVAAGAVAGFSRGLALSGRFGSYYGSGGGGRVQTAFALAGSGANFGLLLGWGFGLVALFATLLAGKRSVDADGRPLQPTPPGGWPAPPAPSDAAWAPGATGHRPPPPPSAGAPTTAPGPVEEPPPTSSWPTRPEPGPTPWPGSDQPGGSGWDRPSPEG